MAEADRGRPLGSAGDRAQFSDLVAEDFRLLASRSGLSANERSGFPDEFRSGRDADIIQDLASKAPALADWGKTIVDLGAGCSDLSMALSRVCEERDHHLVIVDHPEVLAHHTERPGLSRVAGLFPDVAGAVAEIVGDRGADVVLAYSVLQYTGDSMEAFVWSATDFLGEGGRCVMADIPNADMRERFTQSRAGYAYHQAIWGDGEAPTQPSRTGCQLTDARILSLVRELRAHGLHAWVVPQDTRLPMANRREDLVIEKP